MRHLQIAGIIRNDQEYIDEKNFTINIPKVYPLYTVGWEIGLAEVLQYLGEEFPFIYSTGKQGMFMHCNLDQAAEAGLLVSEYIREDISSAEWHKNIGYFQEMKVRD